MMDACANLENMVFITFLKQIMHDKELLTIKIKIRAQNYELMDGMSLIYSFSVGGGIWV